jgi:hypothetical protein
MYTRMPLTPRQLARVKELMSTLHSFAGLIEKIEHATSSPSPDDDEMMSLQKELSRGLEVACDLTKALNQTALALHIELLTRKSL